MRQWLVHPMILCREHLLGEHCEHHMFYGSMVKGTSMSGYLKNNLLEPRLLQQRHDELVAEMDRRKMNHKSPLKVDPQVVLNVLKENIDWKINRDSAKNDLLSRCPICKKRYDFLVKERGMNI